MRRGEYDELLALRTRVTVALLAVAQLQRKHSDPAQAARLSRYAFDALLAAREELERVDALIERLERGAGAAYEPHFAPHARPERRDGPHNE